MFSRPRRDYREVPFAALLDLVSGHHNQIVTSLPHGSLGVVLFVVPHPQISGEFAESDRIRPCRCLHVAARVLTQKSSGSGPPDSRHRGHNCNWSGSFDFGGAGSTNAQGSEPFAWRRLTSALFLLLDSPWGAPHDGVPWSVLKTAHLMVGAAVQFEEQLPSFEGFDAVSQFPVFDVLN